MGLAKKGSRIIAIGDEQYRWVLSPDSGCMWIVVERASGQGQRMEARVTYDDQPNGEQAARVTPAVVRRAIALALADGWAPASSGSPPFRLLDADTRVWHDDA